MTWSRLPSGGGGVFPPGITQCHLEQVLAQEAERLAFCEEAGNLKDAYLQERVLASKWSDDALHVAHAVVARADVIVSWNFRHLVNPTRIRKFNEVNIRLGYGVVVIMTPEDVARILGEQEDDEIAEEF